MDNVNYQNYYRKLDESIEADPSNTEAYVVKGRLMKRQLNELRDIDAHSDLVVRMTETFNQALRLEPGNQEIIGYMTEAYIDEFKLGIQAFNRAREDENQYNVSAQYFTNTSIVRPDSIDPYLNKAYALLQAGRSAEAIEPFEKAIMLGEDEADTYTYLANLYQTMNRDQEAIELLERGSIIFPNNDELRAQLLNAYITGGQMDKAMADYRNAVNAEPNNKLYRYNYGTLLLEAEEYESAQEQFEAAIRIDPGYGVAFYNLGVVHINYAVKLNDDITELDDELRAKRSSMSATWVENTEAKIESLIEDRKESFRLAIEPLERAKELLSADGEDITGICQALFQAYAQVGEHDEAESAAACAGIDLG